MIGFLSMASLAHAQYVPPDRYGDEHQGSDVIRRNDNQVFDTRGHQRRDVKAYFEGSPVGIYLRDSSRVSFTYSLMYQDSTTADTTYRVDMLVGSPAGIQGSGIPNTPPTKPVSPVLLVDAPGISNYYRGNHATELVPAYWRGVYKEVVKRTDLHFYGSSGGPRMAFVVRPGGNPADIKLTFTGQDSLKIDWQGALKVYMQNKWVELRQAVAYQVLPNGSMTNVNWTAAYQLGQNNAVVQFSFGTYDHQNPLVLQIGYEAMQLGGGLDTRDLGWSTYVGGTGDDEFTCVETDELGNAYACGHTLAANFPVAPGNEHYPPFNPDAAGYDNAVITKFNGTSKRVEWATYYGGAVANPSFNPEEPHARTEARKLAVYTANNPDRQYVFATGTTNCTDFQPWAESTSIFSGAVQENYLGGRTRMWVGAFLKEDGTRDWATTHGQGGGAYNSREEGLAIAVNGSGQLAVGGRLHRTVNYVAVNPVFPVVTPVGAYDHGGNTGGAFMMCFHPDYTVRWATTLGNYGDAGYTQLTDLRYESTGRYLWFTGISSGAVSTLDLVASPAGNGYNGTAGSVMFGEFNMVVGPSLRYCTRWGGGPPEVPASIAYGLDFDGKYLWMVGGTNRPSLSATDAPLPAGPSTIYHNLINATGPGNPCDGFIMKFDLDTYQPVYGTLIGGDKYDMLLDVGHDGDNVYITGETRSTNGMAADLDPLRYYQPLNPNVNTRDAVILGIRSQNAPPEMIWRTPYGGIRSERGWGIAGSTAEVGDVYIVGGTASMLFQAFPLKEFDPWGTLDYYQNLNLTGAGGTGSLCSWYPFERGLNFEDGGLGYASTEASHQGNDAFIASFAAQHPVGVEEHVGRDAGNDLWVTPLPAYGQWTVHFPHNGDWTLEAYDTAGRSVGQWKANATSIVANLGDQAVGLYLLRATTSAGDVLSTKVAKP